MHTSVRTRFAPSPTGFLHVGGARTALFAWLYARHYGGQFILRIEDTDLARSTDESIAAIYQGLQWLGIDYDEGPYLQTQRFDRYRQVISQLLAQGDAYRCYCSKERLQALREQQLAAKQKPRYDGHCRQLSGHRPSQNHVIRFANPQQGQVVFDDLIRGPISVANAELDDLIIARSDGSPTYNLTVVVDDWDMRITHVIRGDDHINNTPRQINILTALQADIPRYGHVPMILGADGKRLSKRHGAVSVLEYQQQGILPAALLNYLVRLGWSHQDQEIFSTEQMIALFDGSAIQRSPAAFNPQKLLWLNQHYLKTTDVAITTPQLVALLEAQGIDYRHGPSLPDLLRVQSERCQTLQELITNSAYFFGEIGFDSKAASKHLTPAARPVLQALLQAFAELSLWQPGLLHECVHRIAAELDLKLGKVAQPLRVAVTGGTVSPSIDQTLSLLGKTQVLSRLHQALAFIDANS